MGNIRKFLKYFLPVITLPMLSSYTSSMYSMATNALGTSAIAARSTIASMNTLYSSVLYLMAVAILSVAALLAEKGKVKAAKTLHLVSVIVYSATLVLITVVYMFMSQIWMRFMGAPASVFDMGVTYARTFILPVLLVAAIIALISQLSGKHSFLLCMALCGGIIVLCSFISVALVRIFGFGIVGIAVTDGLTYAIASIAPFLMVPVKSYSNTLAPSVPE